MSSAQEIFDKVVHHLLTQKQRSVLLETRASLEYSCAYRGSGGLKCAIGCLIKDEFYSPELEGKGVGSSIISSALMNSGVDLGKPGSADGAYLMRLLTELQTIHDHASIDRWEDGLRRLADRFTLEFNWPPKGEAQ